MMNNFATLRMIASAILAITFTSTVISQQPVPGDEKSEKSKVGDISGTVLSGSGQPIANASVFIRSIGSSVHRTARTDREGKFHVSGLDQEAYIVSASAPAYTRPARDPDSDQPTVYRIGDFVRLELLKGGVITGTVTTTTGEPVVRVIVRAYLIRDANNLPPRHDMQPREWSTDDRGIYRIYGLPPGTYIVSAGGGTNGYPGYANAYDTDVPIYAPSATRDTASEINVRVGEETNNVDIRYRVEQGHVVSGTATGAGAGTPAEYTIILSSILNGESHKSDYYYQSPGSQAFTFYGVADGDYYLTAQLMVVVGQEGLSEHRRIKVRGADITGIELSTKALGAVTGQLILEESNAPECTDKVRPVFAETLIIPWHNEKSVAKDQPRFPWALGAQTFPDKQGAFTMRNLAPGQYRFNVQSFAKYWYLQSISLTSVASSGSKVAASPAIDAARNWTTLKSGQRISGLNITLASGAASFRGQLRFPEGKQPAPRLFVFLVPAERERAENVVRFFASVVGEDGTFNLDHIPPGRYWVLAKVAPDGEPSILSRLRLPDEVDFRAKLRQEAEAAKTEIELKPCQNVTGFQLPVEPKQIIVPK